MSIPKTLAVDPLSFPLPRTLGIPRFLVPLNTLLTEEGQTYRVSPA